MMCGDPRECGNAQQRLFTRKDTEPVMDFEALRHLRNVENPFANYLGMQVVELTEGYAKAELTVRQEHANPLGICHGGCLYSLADMAAGCCAASFGNALVTSSAEFHYYYPAKLGSVIVAEARPEKVGRSLIVVRVEVKDKESGKLLGSSCFSCFRLEQKIEV